MAVTRDNCFFFIAGYKGSVKKISITTLAIVKHFGHISNTSIRTLQPAPWDKGIFVIDID
jgi:hypothetical protein